MFVKSFFQRGMRKVSPVAIVTKIVELDGVKEQEILEYEMRLKVRSHITNTISTKPRIIRSS